MSIPFPGPGGYRRWNAVLFVNQERRSYRCIGMPTRRIGYDAERATASVVIDRHFDITDGAVVPARIDIVAAGGDGLAARRTFFTGYLNGPAVEVMPFRYRVNLVDLLGQLQLRSLKTAQGWSGAAFEAVIRDILNDSGIPDSIIGGIATPAYSALDSITLDIDSGENTGDLVRDLLSFAGMAIWVTPGGIIRVTDDVNVPAETARFTYVAPYDGADRPMYISPTDALDGTEVVMVSFEARGDRTDGGNAPNYTFTATAPTAGRHGSMTNRFITTTGQAEAIAKREVARNIRVGREIIIPAPLDPELLPGETIRVDITGPPGSGYRLLANAVIRSITTSDARMEMNVALNTPAVDGTGLTDPEIEDAGIDPMTGFLLPAIAEAPLADAAIFLDAEPAVVASVPTLRLFVTVDTSGSRVYTGSITRAISFSSATASPASWPANDVEVATFELDTGSPAGVSLTVTIGDGTNTSTVVRELDDPTIAIYYRPLISANGSTGVRVLLAAGWSAFTRASNATAVPPYNPDTLIAGFADGAVATLSISAAGELSSALTVVWAHPAGSEVSALFVPESNARVILSGHVNGDVYLSENSGASFARIYSGSTAVNDMSSLPDSANYIRIATGNQVLQTYSRGAIWETAQAGPPGAVAEMLADAPWGNACAYSNAGSSANVVRFDQGYSVNWAGVSAAPTALTALTPLVFDPGYVCGDASGNLFQLLWDGSEFDATDIGTIGSGTISDLLRDGTYAAADSPLGQLLYIASTTADATYKLRNQDISELTQIDNPAVPPGTLQIGYAPLRQLTPEPILTYQVYVSGRSADNATYGVWTLDGTTETWTLRPHNLAGVTFFEQLHASPANDQHFLARDSSWKYYFSADACQTWTLAYTAIGNANVGLFLEGGGWIVAENTRYTTGTGTTISAQTNWSATPYSAQGLCRGEVSDEIVYSIEDFPGGGTSSRPAWLKIGDSAPSNAQTANLSFGHPDAFGRKSLYAGNVAGMTYTTDYKVTDGWVAYNLAGGRLGRFGANAAVTGPGTAYIVEANDVPARRLMRLDNAFSSAPAITDIDNLADLGGTNVALPRGVTLARSPDRSFLAMLCQASTTENYAVIIANLVANTAVAVAPPAGVGWTPYTTGSDIPDRPYAIAITEALT